MNLGIENALKAKNYLTITCELIDKQYEPIWKPILDSDKFFNWSGSSNPEVHHYGKHGLIIHTAEVMELALNNRRVLDCHVNLEVLILATLYHDVGKISDYEPVLMNMEDWRATEHKYKIHHITRSNIEWNFIAKYTNLPKVFIDEVSHAILAHHGRLEWHSPVEPQTKVAWLLHLSDYMSAKLYNKEQYES